MTKLKLILWKGKGLPDESSSQKPCHLFKPKKNQKQKSANNWMKGVLFQHPVLLVKNMFYTIYYIFEV